MPQNLSNEECAELARVLRQVIEADRYPLSPRGAAVARAIGQARSIWRRAGATLSAA
jgi:hypothetical protein